jgi:glycerophosphoryl diester phosphodiesterase
VRSRWRWTLGLTSAALVAIYALNASWLAPRPFHSTIKILAHRGVHQGFDLAGVANDTCTARRIRAPIAMEIENTLPSMRADFEAGADVVEIDVHPTTDHRFAVFHDWTLDCRTNGHGPTRSHSMAYLKSLDVGYGYTADGGRTFPLRGKGVGMMPELAEVFGAFPQGRFLINFKSNDPHEGDLLAAMLADKPHWRRQAWGVYGGAPPTDRAIARIAGLRGYSLTSIRGCLLSYIAVGWTGYVPSACRNTILPLPINIAPWLWGWPNRFQERLASSRSVIVLFGAYRRGDVGTSGIDTAAELKRVPNSFDGYISTNAVGTIEPLVAARQPARTISPSR